MQSAARGLVGGNAPALSWLHCGAARPGCWLAVGHASLDLSGHGHKGLLHIGGVLGTGLQERDANLVRKCLQAHAHDIS